MLYPLLFKPVFQERIWGGRSLERMYGKPLPPDVSIGESWEISDRPEGQSIVANGPLSGQSLRWLMEHHERELLGAATSINGRFPLLVKILDAREKLSLQVHPPPAKAAEFGGEPKTEMWYIAEAGPGAELYAGLRRGATRQEFEDRIHSGTVADCFHRAAVNRGDAMFLPSGRVHAIGAGLVIFEIQQNSDTTYRVFDWNRLDSKGRPRPLHVRESLECIDFNDFEPEPIRAAPAGNRRLINDPLFSVDVAHLSAGQSRQIPIESCEVVACVLGRIRIAHPVEPVHLGPGGFSLVPASVGEVQITALTDARLLLACPGRARPGR
jgi:mannose-6-phosphate isomerase